MNKQSIFLLLLVSVLLLVLISAIGCHAQAKAKHKAEPECISGSVRWTLGAEYEYEYEYKCVSGKWTEDKEAAEKRQKEMKEAQEAEVQRQKHLQSLWNDLRSKVVSADELEEIMTLGPKVIPNTEGGGDLERGCGNYGVCSLPTDYKQQEESHRAANEKIFSDALYNQFRMRLLKDKEDSNPCNKECGQ